MRVFNKKYWPYQVRLSPPRDEPSVWHTDTTLKEIERWCYQNVKSKNWNNSKYYFVFKEGKDATMFSLRWE